MKNKFCLLGLLGFAGVIGGGVLHSKTLWAFALFFPLLLLLRVPKGEAFANMLRGVYIRTLAFALTVFSGVMFISAILTQNVFVREQMPYDMLASLYGSCLSLCFAFTIGVFVVQSLAGAVWLKIQKRL